MSLKALSRAALAATILSAPLATTAQADAGFGVGISYVFGEGIAVGVKAFTDDEEEKGVGSVGLDYIVNSGAWRPNVGAAYLDEDVYVDVNAGYNYQTGSWDFGVGGGYADIEEEKAAAIGNNGGAAGANL